MDGVSAQGFTKGLGVNGGCGEDGDQPKSLKLRVGGGGGTSHFRQLCEEG